MITGIAHVNLLVPPGTLDKAEQFYGKTLGFQRVPVPVLQKDTLAWYVYIHNSHHLSAAPAPKKSNGCVNIYVNRYIYHK